LKSYGTADNPWPELPPAASLYSVSWAGDMAVELRNTGHGSTATQYRYIKYSPSMDTAQGSLCYWVKIATDDDGYIAWDTWPGLIVPGVYQGEFHADQYFQYDGNFIQRVNSIIASAGENWWPICRDTGITFDRWIAVQMSWDAPGDKFTIAVDGRDRDWTYLAKLGTVRTLRGPEQIIVSTSFETVSYYDVWFSREFIDFERADNRARFIDSDKKPVPLGADGIKGSPTERKPEFFFHCGSGDDPRKFFTHNLGTEGEIAGEGTSLTVFTKVAKPLAAGEP